ncbi:hypothetical protein F443_02409 [Phytophthora nicotianae P1569]|uniref:Uncharacterized protein n=1 Tax=Phytophthora nicotianae P1569 TaxID=1317065 RepID=V9FWT9_PHYNI|nr:hypothetical protein F443_02409 [Phytophthora nicotianae P1569]
MVAGLVQERFHVFGGVTRECLATSGVHEKLVPGCTIEARGVDGSASGTSISIKKSSGICFFGRGFSAADLEPDKYYVATKENSVAIDSFYYSTSPPQILLFKMLVGAALPVTD